MLNELLEEEHKGLVLVGWHCEALSALLSSSPFLHNYLQTMLLFTLNTSHVYALQ